MYEDRHGRVHTVVVGALNAAVGVIALVGALLLFVVVSGLPLWLFPILLSIVDSCAVPFRRRCHGTRLRKCRRRAGRTDCAEPVAAS